MKRHIYLLAVWSVVFGITLPGCSQTINDLFGKKSPVTSFVLGNGTAIVGTNKPISDKSGGDDDDDSGNGLDSFFPPISGSGGGGGGGTDTICSYPETSISNFDPNPTTNSQTAVQIDPSADVADAFLLIAPNPSSFHTNKVCELTISELSQFSFFGVNLDAQNNFNYMVPNIAISVAMAFVYVDSAQAVHVTNIIGVDWVHPTSGQPTYRFAAFGDQGQPGVNGLSGGARSQALLEMLAGMDLDFLVHLGDFGYDAADPNWYMDKLQQELDPDYPLSPAFPVLAIRGNHDYQNVYENFDDTLSGSLFNCQYFNGVDDDDTGTEVSPGQADKIGDRVCTVGNGDLTFVMADDNPYNKDISDYVALRFSENPAKFRFFVKHMTRKVLSPYKSNEFHAEIMNVLQNSGVVGLGGHSHGALMTYPMSLPDMTAMVCENNMSVDPVLTTSSNFTLGPGAWVYYLNGMAGWQHGQNNNCKTSFKPNNPCDCPHMAYLHSGGNGQASAAGALIFEVYMEENPPRMVVSFQTDNNAGNPPLFQNVITSGH